MGFLSRPDVLLFIVAALPFVAALLIIALKRVAYVQEALSSFASLTLFPATCGLYAVTFCKSGSAATSLSYSMSSSMLFILEPDALGMAFGVLVSLLWCITNVYTIGYMNKAYGAKKDLSTFYACFAASIGCTMGIAFSGNLVTLFIFYEMLTISTYPLIVHDRSPSAFAAGSFYLKTLLCASVTSFLPLLAVVWSISHEAGLFSSQFFVSEMRPGVIPLLSALLCYGVAKAAIMPVHMWLPRAMVAPTPVSALLHAVAVVKSGVFTIIKVTVCVFGAHGMYSYYSGSQGIDGVLHLNVLLYLSAFTMIGGSVLALMQKELKKLLAYSTVSQLSCITLALAMYTDLSVASAMLQMVCHAFAKITLFFAAGAIYITTGRTSIDQMDGLGRAMPVTLAAFCLGAFSMIGIPPAPTFWSKFYILSEAVRQDSYLVIFAIALSTLLNTIYFVPVVYRAFFGDASALQKFREAPPAVIAAMLATSACTAVLFFKPGIVFKFLESMGLPVPS
ncbi:proton-conducting transporter membrane subunit [Candidatus Anaplasma sp. TIGMIC]|uniref:proton-conducting transporter transmembrane domain-containing protein n=1 Tax=Candidatus Anaplasma sp. TIGMIC TaxID=3020713 RepID=UPI00232BA431|nr:proton-conducting transporter membrane subunit [Candidatus Anaplasma sp. TIGMIC]MDB1135541.1 proton-conducting transporter membrane subunit [Candidatus Anaplasma sp. TIGMIC]